MTIAATEPSRPTADDELHRAVASLVVGLQHEHLTSDPAAAGRLAQLRRGLTSAPGSVPEIWQETVGILPSRLHGRGDSVSSYEVAAHSAVCLYALHQQAQENGMHVREQDLGSAVRAYRRKKDSEGNERDPVLSRFQALATATSTSETLYHLRGLVTLLRGEAIGLDYGRLAVDLRRLTGGRPGSVRLVWGRSLYSWAQPRTPADPTTGPTPAGTEPDPHGEDA